MENLKLEDFIPDYPLLEDEDFFIKIARKKEFQELTLEPEMGKGAKESLYPSQKYMQRIFSPYTSYTKGALFHVPGTGKTCAASAIVEGMKSGKITKERRALIFVKNEGLVKDFKAKIIKDCAKDIYSKTDHPEKELKPYYEIVTYSHINSIYARKGSGAIKKLYSGRTVIIDEAHTVTENPPKEKGEKMVDPTWKKFWWFLHEIEDSIVIVMTGTPIWDKTSGFASLMNLILPKDQQLPHGSFDRTFFSEEDEFGNKVFSDPKGILRKAIRGRVSYLRASGDIVRVEKGITRPLSRLIKVWPDVWSKFQEDIVSEARNKEVNVSGGIGKPTKKVIGGVMSSSAMSASIMVYPKIDAKTGKIKEGGIYDTPSFEDMFPKNKGKPKYDSLPLEVRKEIKTNLRKYSAKIADIVEDVIANPKDVTFIFCENVSGVGGVYSVGICLQEHGLFWNKGAKSIMTKSTDKRRFTILTSTHSKYCISSDHEIGEFLQLHNRPDNKFGEYSQVIIGSEKVLLGLDIKNVRKVRIMAPHWNDSAIKQVEARAIRLGALDAFKDPKDRKVEVYLHVGVKGAAAGQKSVSVGLAPEGEYFSADGRKIAADQKIEDGKVPVDLYVLALAEQKVSKSSPIERMIKEESFDCVAFYKRNVLETDVDGSRECNYQECNYQCDGIPPPDKSSRVWDYASSVGELDYSTYNLLYGGPRIRELMNKIKMLFKKEYKYELKELQEKLGVTPEEFSLYLAAIDNLINSRTIVKNRLGFECYVKHHGNHIFLDHKISSSTSFQEGYSQAEYTERMLVSSIKTLSSQVSDLEVEKDLKVLDELCDTPTAALIDDLSMQGKIDLFEQAFLTAQTEPEKADLSLIKIFLKEFSGAYSVVTQRSPKKKGSTKKEPDEEFTIHLLYKLEKPKKGSYALGKEKLKADGKTRIYEPDKARWTWLTDLKLEERYMNQLTTKRKTKTGKEMVDSPYGIYGLVPSGGEYTTMKIVWKKGMAATSYKMPQLRAFLLDNIKYDAFANEVPEVADPKLKAELTSNIKAIKKMEKTTLVSYITAVDDKGEIPAGSLEGKSLDELRNIYFFLSQKNRKPLIAYIYTALNEADLLR